MFLVWSNYFKDLALADNPEKKFECIVTGNPVYNKYDRTKFKYKAEVGKKILVAVSLIKNERYNKVNNFMKKLVDMGFEVTVKEHNYQSKKYKSFEWGKKVPKGKFTIYEALSSMEFDIVMTDVSTVMNDIIFFKNRALFFSPDGESDYFLNNVYAKFLTNVALHTDEIENCGDLERFIDVEAQERLLDYLIETKGKHNRLDYLS
jgi:CDP-glycerol glycerophosphotransferase (TagB/SpsB family)